MDIRILRYFLAVAREENITRAAETLHISQPSLSKQLIDLESELDKTLLIRGKRKITLTEDGILLRKRAEEIINLVDKTEQELSSDISELNGEISIGGNMTPEILSAAADIRKKNHNLHFQFYSGDAIDVLERLDNGSLDFAVFLQPIDATKYDYISLPDSSRWGLLMPKDCPLAEKDCIEKSDLLSVPLIFHRRAGLQSIISHWAQADIEQFDISATYNVINGSPFKFAESGLGYFFSTEDLIPDEPDSRFCFRPLKPELSIHYAFIWKKYSTLSKNQQRFISTLRSHLKKIDALGKDVFF